VPLPDNPNEPWPPPHWAPIARDQAEAAVWYSGDQDALARFYGAQTNGQDRRPSDGLRSVAGKVSAWFWGRRYGDEHTDRQRIHVPAASDVAATSADLLFGEPPSLVIPEAHEANAPSDAKDAEDRLNTLVEEDGIASTLLEAAEICAAIGDVYLRPLWDRDVAPDHPLLTVVHGDRALPEFRWGHLVAVTFWREVMRKGAEVWRHLERHEPGLILHGLYVGRDNVLGAKVDLARHDATAGFDVDELGAINTRDLLGVDGLIVRHVPNVKPNRRHRGYPIGRHDTTGQEGLMDALDETFTSWMRDIRLGKARLVVPNEFLVRAGRGAGARFDTDQEVFSPLDIDPSSAEKAGITPVQFQIRVAEHERTAMALFERIVSGAGYSPQSFGLEGDGATQTATEVDARQDRSARTNGRKQRYWRRPFEDVAELLLVIDNKVFGSGVEPYRPRLDFPDASEAGTRDMAETLNLLTMAASASIETRVRMFHPEWDETQVQEEVERIKDEQPGGGGFSPDPTGLPPAGGEPEPDATSGEPDPADDQPQGDTGPPS
jgi:hypothetical protein